MSSVSKASSKKDGEGALDNSIASVASSLSSFVEKYANKTAPSQHQPSQHRQLLHESLHFELDEILRPVPHVEVLKFHLRMAEQAMELAEKFKEK